MSNIWKRRSSVPQTPARFARSSFAHSCSMAESESKQLRIKTGTLRRLRKELGMYQDEEAKESAKVAKLRHEAADSHDIKYAVGGPQCLRNSAHGMP